MKSYRKIKEYVKPYYLKIFLCILASIVTTICTLVNPVVIGYAVDNMIGIDIVDFLNLKTAVIILALLFIANNIFTWLLTLLTNKISFSVVNKIRRDLFDKISTLPLNFYDNTAHGNIISHFINDSESLADGLLQGSVAFLQGIFTIIGTTAFMFYLNVPMAVTVVIFAPFSFMVARFITLKSQNLFQKQANLVGKINGYAEEMIEGHNVLKAYNYENNAIKNFKEINNNLYTVGTKSLFISAMSNPATRIVNNIGYISIGIMGSYLALKNSISIGEISTFLIYTNIFSKPFNDITSVISQIQASVASANRIKDILNLEPEPLENNTETIKDCEGFVTFNDVNFSYDKSKNLIENFTLNIEAGKKVAIVGQTGAGKTTIINLLMRFYDIDSGDIYIDGINIKNVTRDNLRKQFGLVLQETWLFNGSIKENIAYSKPNATFEEIQNACKEAGADKFIDNLKDGYDTIINANGNNLSQGQKQLLTIARVMLLEPSMIILDEATSNIDTFTEVQIHKAFDKLTSGKTSFVIAHRLSTIKNADIIVVMNKGNIVESGNHDELLKKGGYYYNLYNSQFA